MASELTSALAEAFVREVSDAQLMRFARIFDPARAKREEFFARLIQAADQGQRELLWKLIAAAVGDAINRLLVFVNLEHEERELRLILRDPVSGSEEPFLDDDDLIDLHAMYWTEWEPAFSRVASGYPAPTGEDAEPSDVPTGRDAVAERSSQSAWIESLAPTFIEEVRDRALLLDLKPYLFGTWAVFQQNAVYRAFISHLDEARRDVLWKLLVECVDTTCERALDLVDRRLAAGQLRLEVAVPQGARPLLVTEPANLAARFRVLLARHGKMTERPKQSRGYVRPDDVPEAVRAAVARDFPDVEIRSQEWEITSTGKPPPVYLFLLAGKDEMVAYNADGTRVPSV